MNRHAREGAAACFAATFAAARQRSGVELRFVLGRFVIGGERLDIGEVGVGASRIVIRPIDGTDAVGRDVGAFDDVGVVDRRAALAGARCVAVAA